MASLLEPDSKFEQLSEEQQQQRLLQCMTDDERARLGARAIECGSTAVAAAGADAIINMAADATSDANNILALQSCLAKLARQLRGKCTAVQATSMLKALAKISQLTSETCSCFQ